MKIDTLQIFSYELPLKKALVLKGVTLSSRRGLLLQMSDENGRSAFSDIAPLPHFSPENLPDTLDVYAQIKPKLLKTHWSLKTLFSQNNILYQSLDPEKFPSLFFAIEFALLSLMMPSVCTSPHIQINSLLMGSDEVILQRMPLLKSFSRIKLKPGPRSPEKLGELIERILPYMQEGQKLRIDFNRSWDIKQTLAFCEKLPLEYCDYLEEPLKNPAEYLSLSNYTAHPIAFDESLLDTPLNLLLSVPTKKAFVIKPSLMGSLQKINFYYQKACRYKLDFVLSSAFESGLGHLMIAHLCRYLGIEAAIGLDTYTWLKKDVLMDPLKFTKGTLLLKMQNLVQPELNKELLKPIYV